jgi:hypothetical protein
MGALEPAEAEPFRRHLEGCPVCRAEVDGFEDVVRAMPLAAAQHRAPRSLRRRVMHEVNSGRELAKPHRWAPPLRRSMLTTAGAVALLAGAVIGGAQLGGSPSTHVYAASVGDAVVKVSGGRAELVVKHLPQPGAGKIYEVWFKHGSAAPEPARALFGVDTSGKGDVVVPSSVRGVTTLMVTAEPDGGKHAPTSAPVIVASLT